MDYRLICDNDGPKDHDGDRRDDRGDDDHGGQHDDRDDYHGKHEERERHVQLRG